MADRSVGLFVTFVVCDNTICPGSNDLDVVGPIMLIYQVEVFTQSLKIKYLELYLAATTSNYSTETTHKMNITSLIYGFSYLLNYLIFYVTHYLMILNGASID